MATQIRQIKESLVRNRNFIRFMPVAIVILLIMSGCGAKPEQMALQKGAYDLDLAGGGIGLFSLHTDNQFKPAWPPEVYGITVTDQASGHEYNFSPLDIQSKSLLSKAIGDAFTVDKGTSSWDGRISLQLPPGSYRLTAIRGGCTKGIGIAVAMASFDFPFDIPFTVAEKEIIYLGRIEMINRERRSDDEVPAGDNLVTRLPQRQSGFGTGTFDVRIFDNYEPDMGQFFAEYPALYGKKIIKRILTAWTRPQ